jgi:hypothetical protein
MTQAFACHQWSPSQLGTAACDSYSGIYINTTCQTKEQQQQRLID